ncbi:MAG: TIGR00730 family Rossman fold protein [Christensenella sp.]
MKKICVYGSSSSAIDKKYLDTAYHLGALIAKSGQTLVFGAGTMGMMGAVARGVKSEDGCVIGIIPEFLNIPGIPFESCDEYIVLPTMRDRKQKMEDLSDAFIAAPGGFGTFEELTEIITLKQLKRHQKPIIILNTHGFFDELLAMFDKTVTQNFAKPDGLSVYTTVATPEEAISAIQNYHYVEPASKWFTPED